MIEVVYCPKAASLTVSGHAPAEPERDYSLVCAAVSHNLRLFEHAVTSFSSGGALSLKSSVLSRGFAKIEYSPTFNYAINVSLGLILEGFRMLSASYPEQISYKIQNESEVKTE